MERVFPAEPAILLCLHSVRMVSFFFGCIVVALFALRTFQSDLSTHFRTSVPYYFFATQKKDLTPCPNTITYGRYGVKCFFKKRKLSVRFAPADLSCLGIIFPLYFCHYHRKATAFSLPLM
jgi:hypothetical protein